MSRGEKTAEEIPNSLHFESPNLSVLLQKSLPWHATLISKPKMDQTEIYLNACHLPRCGNPKLQWPNAIIDELVTVDTLDDLGKDSRWIQRPNVWISDVSQDVLDRKE